MNLGLSHHLMDGAMGVIKDSFKSSKKAFIRVTPKSATFSDSARRYKGTYILDENEVIEMYNYMIDSCYIQY